MVETKLLEEAQKSDKQQEATPAKEIVFDDKIVETEPIEVDLAGSFFDDFNMKLKERYKK